MQHSFEKYAASQTANKTYYDKIYCEPTKYKIDDYVLVRN